MKKQGSVFGGMLLLTGSCIGAGMLGLPILTGLSGFFPTFVMFLIAWLFMTTTALLLVEVLGWFDRPVNLISMVGHSLGPIGRVLCWILYLLLFYSLLVAYMVLCGNHTSQFSMRILDLAIPDSLGTVFFVIIFGWLIYLGTRPVDHVNRMLMFGKIIAFILLVIFGIQYIVPKFLLYFEPKYALYSLPILVICFGFHNMVPSLYNYLGRDRRRMRQTIWAGSILTATIYLIWEIIALGILPYETIAKAFKLDIGAAEAILEYVHSSMIGVFAQFLAFFAILTSFLAQSLGLTHFLRDGFKLKKKEREYLSMCALALIPPLVCSILYPGIFFRALNFAGGICAVVLFGIFPALMVWIGRYQKKKMLPDRVRGGKPLLILIILIASFIFFYQLTQTLDLNVFPTP